jgi:hypothetical protein
MSRHLRGNQQLHLEAQDTLYGSGLFIFEWAHSACTGDVNIFVSKRSLTPMNMMKSIAVRLWIGSQGTPETQLRRAQRRQVLCIALLAALPALASVRIWVDFVSGEVDAHKAAQYVDTIVQLAGVSQSIPRLELIGRTLPSQLQKFEIA